MVKMNDFYSLHFTVSQEKCLYAMPKELNCPNLVKSCWLKTDSDWVGGVYRDFIRKEKLGNEGYMEFQKVHIQRFFYFFIFFLF